MYNPVIEMMSRETLLDLQWKRLQLLLRRAYKKSEFYRRHFDTHGVVLEDIKSIDDFRKKVPYINKKDLLKDQEENPPYGSRLLVSPSKVRMLYLTSGTSGVGQEIYGQTLSDQLLSGSKFMDLPVYLSGLRRGDTVYNMTPVATLAFGLMVTEVARLAGWNFIQAFQMDSKTKIKTMQRIQPHGIIASSVHMVRLTQVCMEMGIDPRNEFPNLKTIIIAGQSYPIETVQRIEKFWGVKLYEVYGSSQGLGLMAGTCENGCVTEDGRRGKMHIFEHNCLLEVIDPETGEHVKDGETGIGVITNLDVEGSPLIRFFTNDRMRYFSPDSCNCGRQFAAIEAGSISRNDDMIKIRGMNIWPQTIDNILFGFDYVAEYSATVKVSDKGNEDVHIKVAFRPEIENQFTELDKLEFIKEAVGRIKGTCNVTMNITVVPRSELPVYEFKAIRWHDQRQKDLAKKVW